MDSVWLTGDPGGMRALAGSLRGIAAGIAAVQDAADGTVAAAIFEGPAGDRFRTRMRGQSRSAQAAIAQLHDLAGTLDGAASQVEAAQAEERRLEEARREAEARAAKAAAR